VAVPEKAPLPGGRPQITAGRRAQTIAACCRAKLSATRGGSRLKSSSDRGAVAGRDDRCGNATTRTAI